MAIKHEYESIKKEIIEALKQLEGVKKRLLELVK